MQILFNFSYYRRTWDPFQLELFLSKLKMSEIFNQNSMIGIHWYSYLVDQMIHTVHGYV